MGGGETAFGIVMIVSSAAVVLGALGMIRGRLRDRTPPERVLARRLAAGEISHDEYLMTLGILHEGRELTRPE